MPELGLISQSQEFYDLFEQSAVNLMTASERSVNLPEHLENLIERPYVIAHRNRNSVTLIDRKDLALHTSILEEVVPKYA